MKVLPSSIFPVMLLVAAMFFCRQVTYGQNGFVRYFTEDSDRFLILGILPLPDNEFLLSGSIGIYPHTHNIRVDAFGNPVWKMDTMAWGIDYKGMDASLGDSLFFSGGYTSYDQQTMCDPFLHCYDASGTTRWIKTYDVYPCDAFSSICISPQGQVYALGAYQHDLTMVYSSFLTRFDLDGDTIWQLHFRDSRNVFPSGMIALPDGDLLLSTTYGRVPHLFRIDSAKTILWERVYADMLWREPFMYMHPMSNGNILCVGRDSTLRELSPNGDILRSAEENGTLAHAFQTADGGIIAYGTLADGNELYIRKRNPDWSEDWYKIYELPGDNYINQIIESIEGDLVMVGWNGTNFFEPTQGLLIRTDCQGNIVDYQVCNPPVEDYTLWPNPNGGHATLSIPPDFLDKAHAIQVFNALGQSVMEVALPQDAPTVELDAASMEQGVYFLRVWRDGEARWTTRWLIRR